MQRYRNTEIGYVMMALVAIALVICIGLPLAISGRWGPELYVGPIIVSFVLFLFPTLTTEVDETRVRCAFGLGLIRREVALRDIAEAAIVRTHWFYGWGIRLIPGGWLWRVSSLDGIELKLRSGKLLQIGTNDAAGLADAIRSRLLST